MCVQVLLFLFCLCHEFTTTFNLCMSVGCLLCSQSLCCTGHFTLILCFAFNQFLLIRMSASLNAEGVLDKWIAEGEGGYRCFLVCYLEADIETADNRMRS